jgi:hypothetical protein
MSEERVATLPDLSTEIKEAARQAGGGWLDEVVDHHHGRVPLEAIKGAWRLGPDGEPTGEYVANPKYVPAAERPKRCPFGY